MTGKAPFYGQSKFMRAGSNAGPQTQIAIIGCAFDQGVTNRPGTRFGPDSIRNTSIMLCDGHNPIYKNDPISQGVVKDLGNIWINPNGVKQGLASILENSQLWLLGKYKPIYLGGDHTISLPALEYIHSLHGPVGLVHFDAHCDVWPENFGQSIGHGSVFYHAINQGFVNPKNMVQIGIRSPVDNQVAKWAKDHEICSISAMDVHMQSMYGIADSIKQRIGNVPVYLTIDIDVFDPSQAPGTGTPEVGGLWSWQVLKILQLIQNLNWVGGDVVEVCPPYDHAEITSLLGATLVWNMCSMFSKGLN